MIVHHCTMLPPSDVSLCISRTVFGQLLSTGAIKPRRAACQYTPCTLKICHQFDVSNGQKDIQNMRPFVKQCYVMGKNWEWATGPRYVFIPKQNIPLQCFIFASELSIASYQWHVTLCPHLKPCCHTESFSFTTNSFQCWWLRQRRFTE